MSDRVYRVVVDTWPTPDGNPFSEQDPEVWEWVGHPEAPKWLPSEEAMGPWHRSVYKDDDPWEIGYEEYVAPNVDTRRCLARKTADRRLDAAQALGVTAHIESAPIGGWKPLP
ncbi:hypothetical protein [Prescottella agglutinans]|uniref:Uncharacterized protein n=1 Tax=Prescottella agglutinans TaxID=1644129 RepID=A0ABT6MIC2_9NOCA|nr:hypothetical protein [Prescottella agglutinans]MDH6284047.1 hypothetical protein [Prescottella agglutinans]